MKVLDYNQAQSGFVKTHQPCPCGQHKGCYSERENGSGYCHSCGKNHPSSNLATTYTYHHRYNQQWSHKLCPMLKYTFLYSIYLHPDFVRFVSK